MAFISPIAFAIVTVAAFGFFFKKAKEIYRNINLGQKENLTDQPGERLKNMLLIALVLQLMGVLFKRQLKKQRGFVEKKRAKKTVTPAERLGSRIQQAEFATLMASFGVVVLLGVLIWFSLEGWVSLSNAIVLFLALRIQNTTFSSVSSSLMRFARAKANSF